jgi:hypothetical protein
MKRSDGEFEVLLSVASTIGAHLVGMDGTASAQPPPKDSLKNMVGIAKYLGSAL